MIGRSLLPLRLILARELPPGRSAMRMYRPLRDFRFTLEAAPWRTACTGAGHRRHEVPARVLSLAAERAKRVIGF